MTRTATAPAARRNVLTAALCGCGCGISVKSANSVYAPGHDARHAGLVAREVVRTGDTALIRQLPSQALRVKATKMATRLAEPKPSKSVKAVKAPNEGTVKIGRWVYPARRLTDGTIVRNTKRDGSGEWTLIANVALDVA